MNSQWINLRIYNTDMHMTRTARQYDEVEKECREVFLNKMEDYGSSWRILRASSLTDQIYIKARRIRNIEEKKGEMRIAEGTRPEYIGIINYGIMALIQLELENATNITDDQIDIPALYNKWFANVRSLMEDKNHDYDEAWRNMRISSLTDIILMKLNRIKQIEDHHGKTFVSEGLDANYADIINYAVFAMIKINEA
jgi:hypothetical protein